MINIIITGLYRSGTTFIEKILDTHPDADILHQPLTTYFKTLDELVWTQMKGQAWPDKPMGYEAYWSLYGKKTLKDLNFDQDKIDFIIRSSKEAAINHPGKNSVLFPQKEFYDLLEKKVKPSNAEEVLLSIFECIALYRESDGEYVGLKEIFLAPYLPFMANIKNLTIINVIRDPREIYFSRNYNSQKALFGSLKRHPVKMIATIWRNHMLINGYLNNRYDNIINVYYDDIRDNSDAVVAQLTKQLNLDSTQEKDLKDEAGKEWTINTSDKSGKPGFGKKWAEEMSQGHIAMIEYICGDVMELVGYKRFLDVEECESLVSGYEEDLDTLKEWTKVPELTKLSA